MKLKIAIIALSLMGFSNVYADSFVWHPHLKDGYQCTHAQYCGLGANADIGIINDTDQDHDYTVRVWLGSDAGDVIGPHATSTGTIHVPAHDSWGCNQQVFGSVKFNNMGQREITLNVLFTGPQQFSATQKGWIQAV